MCKNAQVYRLVSVIATCTRDASHQSEHCSANCVNNLYHMTVVRNIDGDGYRIEQKLQRNSEDEQLDAMLERTCHVAILPHVVSKNHLNCGPKQGRWGRRPKSGIPDGDDEE